MEVYYIEAGIFEEMLARADSLSAQVDRLYEKNREKKPGEWMDNQDVCLDRKSTRLNSSHSV